MIQKDLFIGFSYPTISSIHGDLDAGYSLAGRSLKTLVPGESRVKLVFHARYVSNTYMVSNCR